MPTLSAFQGMLPNGLFSGAPNQIQPAVTDGNYQPGGVLTPGYYSQLAYQMAGSPTHGPYTPGPGPNYPSSFAAPGGASASGAGGGLLGTLAQNPNLAKNLYNLGSGILGTQIGSPAWEAGLDSGASTAIPPATPAVGSIEAPAGDLYSGASGASGAGADPAAGSYGSFASPDTSGDSVSVTSQPENYGAYAAGAGGAGGLLGATPSGAVTITDLSGNVLAGDAAGSAAGGAADAGGAAAGSGLGAALGAAGYGAGAIALPFLLNDIFSDKSKRPYDSQLSMLESLQNVDPALYQAGMKVLNSQGPAALTGFFGGIFGPSGGNTKPAHATVQS